MCTASRNEYPKGEGPLTCIGLFISLSSRVDKQKNELGRWKSRIVAMFLLFLTL